MSKKRGEGIIKISALFEKYTKNLIAPESTVIVAFQEVVSDLFGFQIKKEQCTYTSGSKTLVLVVSGPLKSEILLKKKEILTHLKGRLGERNAPKEIL